MRLRRVLLDALTT